VDDSAEPGLALHNGIWNAHLSAESRKEDDELDGIDIVGNEDQAGLLVLNQANDVIETVLDGVWLLANILLLLAIRNSGGLGGKTLLLRGLGLRAVLVQEFEGLGGSVAVEDILELSNRWGDFQAEVEDLALALEANILRPPNHAGEVAPGLNVLADAIVAGTLLEERVLP